MRLTVLGNWSPYPAAGGACSGYLLEAEDTKILLECGNGITGKLHEYYQAWDLDAIIISHHQLSLKALYDLQPL